MPPKATTRKWAAEQWVNTAIPKKKEAKQTRDAPYRPGGLTTGKKPRVQVRDPVSEEDDEDTSTTRKIGPPTQCRHPKMPAGAARVNVENDLGNDTVALGRDMERIWYYFDLEDPAAKFRAVTEDTPMATVADVLAGDGPLTDDPLPSSLPVEVVAYPWVYVLLLRLFPLMLNPTVAGNGLSP